MKRFIYSIQDIFNRESGCLFDYNAKGFYIAPYQRGYKWKSESFHDQVPVLLLDVYEAFKKNIISKNNQEYYLQYITVKKQGKLFEVIDGQQRLTTLTLIFNVLEVYFDIENCTKYKNEFLLTYSRYEQENIFDEVIALQNSEKDGNFLAEQDKYYMLSASVCIKKFLEILNSEEHKNEFEKFIIFLKENVKIIVNIEDENTSAEEVFANLNDNKVPLTNAYLIKGLLLTKASRLSQTSENKGFIEIMDERTIMGRMWDEINTWFSNKDVALYFFGSETDGMENMLKLVTFKTTDSDTDVINTFKDFFSSNKTSFASPYELFNEYHEHIITTQDAFGYLSEIKHIYKRLKSWYYDDEIYNLIGYKQIVSNYRVKDKSIIKDLLSKESNEELLKDLKGFLLSKLPDSEKIKTLNYNNSKPTLYFLLAINVFPSIKNFEEKTGNFRNFRFDFYSFKNENWSLEHIFPQNPNSNNFNLKDDKDWVLKKIDKKKKYLSVEEKQKYDDLIKKIKNDEEIESSEIDFVFDEFKDHDILGNMALLSGKVNSALSNGFFNTKRKILLNKINQGSFVPKHTIDVFSKMLEIEEYGNLTAKFDDSLTVWSEKDADAHFVFLKQSTENLINKFQLK